MRRVGMRGKSDEACTVRWLSGWVASGFVLRGRGVGMGARREVILAALSLRIFCSFARDTWRRASSWGGQRG